MKIDKRLTLKILTGSLAAAALPLGALRLLTPDRLSTVAGGGAKQKGLNGPQTTGRAYRNLSAPIHKIKSDRDVAATMRDGTKLMVDVHRPAEPGRYPVLLAASPYPRQAQDLGAPLGFIEAGNTEFFVPRGYVHVIANLRGTGGSEGTFGFFDGQERRDMHDLVEWVATQPWSDGNVGMVGISYFAMTQLEAAVEQPPHLKAIFPLAGTFDLYESACHHGLVSTSFMTPFLAMIGMTSKRPSSFWNGWGLDMVRRALGLPALHSRFATFNGEAAMAGIKVLLKLHHDPRPWDELWRDIVVEHPLRDAWWDERNILPLLPQVKIPTYLGCDWDNVPMHLPSTFTAYAALDHAPDLRVAMLGDHGLAWPWESLHVETLAWYDHWLKGRDTGILEGPAFRYVVPQAGPAWRAAKAWPVEGMTYRPLALRHDGALADDEGPGGERQLMVLGEGLVREKRSSIDPPATLAWTTAPLKADLDMVGDIELQLDATSTASDTAWFAYLQDVDPAGTVVTFTAGYLRASLRQVDEAKSRVGAPVLPCRVAEPVPVGEIVKYRIPITANARRFKSGHRLRLLLASDDQDPAVPALLTYRHASVGTSSLNTVRSSSRLLLPVLGSA